MLEIRGISASYLELVKIQRYSNSRKFEYFQSWWKLEKDSNYMYNLYNFLHHLIKNQQFYVCHM